MCGVRNRMDAIVALFLRKDGTKSNLTGICLENKSVIGSKARISKDGAVVNKVFKFSNATWHSVVHCEGVILFQQRVNLKARHL